MEFIELHVLPNSQLVGKRLGDMSLPDGSTFSLIVRGQKPLIPTVDTVVQVDDRLFGFTPVAQESNFKRVVS
jgi:trk system potassium uptake protein TrkA